MQYSLTWLWEAGKWSSIYIKLKLQYFGHFMQRVNSLEKTLMLGGIRGRRRRGPRSALEKDPRPGPLFEGNPVGEGTTRTGTANPVHHPQRHVGSTHSSTMGLMRPASS